ncbi:Disease resistance protein RPM1 [Dichanthelium oligosanthes]|uniref:Disease resistance protein RPM1 n=1 Tax=Dichanthelium oligosanthes TaxID=888268 RepID=A0A1E5VV95_9POAL|nr:Disease resistance protein RPM1 [Dichanthelium oligosanthes]
MALAAGAIGALLPKLHELSKEDRILPRRVGREIMSLIAELENIQSALHRVSEAEQLDQQVKLWTMDADGLYHRIDGLIDTFTTGGSQTAIPSGDIIARIKSKLTTAKARRKFASTIRNENRLVHEFVNRHERYRIDSTFFPFRPPRSPASGVADDSGNGDIGIMEMATVAELDALLADANNVYKLPSGLQADIKFLKADLEIVRVVLRKIAEVPAGELDEVTEAWADDLKDVSRNVKRAVDNFQARIGSDPPQSRGKGYSLTMSSMKARRQFARKIRDLKDCLLEVAKRRQRYFVVIDDLWDLAAWNTMEHALVGKSNGSAVLTTSRKFDIAEYVGGLYTLHPLSKTDSRKLLYKRLFNSEDKCPTGLAEKTEKFIEKCGGIPAAINATAVLLASKPWTEKEWYEVHGTADYKLEQALNDPRKILDTSYNDLPFHLKPCLLYMTMFPKGYEISTEHLVWLWIAEGIIQEIQGEILQEVGESYLNELIKRKFIKSVEVNAGGKDLSCSVYDMVYDFIISKSTEQNFVAVVDSSQGRSLPDRVYRLSIQGNSSERTPLQGPLLSDNDHLMGIDNSFLLKYLVIGGNCITGLPQEIANLKLLQTLDLRASGLKELPESVVLIRRLERLCVNSHMNIPDWIGKMEALQELGDINISKPELLKELCKLTKLRVLRFAIWTWDESYDEALLVYLDSLVMVKDRHQNIQSLSILTCCSLNFMGKLDVKLDDKWTPPSFQKLEIKDSAFFTLPRWIGSLQNLSSLTVEVYKLSQEMVDILGKLQSLSSLSMTSKHAPEGKFCIVTDGFKNLTSLHFATNAMGQMFASEPKAMQMLKRLQLWFKALQTEEINQGFNFGVEDLCSLEHVRVEIVCFNATRRVVENAEAAIREAISRGRSRRPNLEIRRVRAADIIENEDEVVVSNTTNREQEKETNNKKSSSRKIRVLSKKFRQKEKGVPRKYRIVSVNLKSHILTLQAL